MAEDRTHAASPASLAGHPLRLTGFRAESVTNRQFARFNLGPLDRCYLPSAVAALCDDTPLGERAFLEDDNRGAVSPEPVATLDGQPFHLSVKGVGSTVEPFSYQPLDRRLGASLTDDPEVRRRLLAAPGAEGDRLLTGELWLRGSPYGGQGWEHASTALRVSESADLTSIRGFLIAPVVKVVLLPPVLEERIRSIHWYRKFPGRIVQEIRLVPSNVRVYLHAQSTLGHSIRQVFDRFGLDSPAKVHGFQTNFLRSAVAMLTVFARSIDADPSTGRFTGFDFYDVWLDKDAVLAPNGAVYFVDLEGVETVSLEADAVREKLEDQVFRSMYELAYAYEQIERERARRFGEVGSRKEQFARLLEEALRDDPVVRLRRDSGGLEMEIHANCQKGEFRSTFRWVDA